MVKNNPILIHVGFHKTGSTLLKEYFSNHNAVHCIQEEITMFANDPNTCDGFNYLSKIATPIFITNMRLTVNNWGKTNYQSINNNTITAETIRSNQEKIASQFKKHLPNAKILITTREIDKLKKSLYSQYLLNGGTRTWNEFSAKNTQTDDFFNFKYIQDLYIKLFGESNVIVLQYEQLKMNPSSFFNQICDLLQIPYIESDFKIINRSLDQKEMKYLRRKNILFNKILKLFPNNRRTCLFKSYIKSNLKKHSKKDR